MTYGFVHTTLFRLIVALLVGGVVGVLAVGLGHAVFAALVGWIVAAALFCGWTWLLVHRLDAAQAREFATREDPGRGVGDIVLIAASLIAVGGVGVLISASSSKQGGADLEALVGVASVAASWFVVHVMFMLRYARLYHVDAQGRDAGDDERAIDFNEDDEPDYGDFAYLAFTLGMTYQVSDTDLKTKAIRHTALRHSLLSFLLGAVVLASTINLVSQLASSGGQ